MQLFESSELFPRQAQISQPPQFGLPHLLVLAAATLHYCYLCLFSDAGIKHGPSMYKRKDGEMQELPGCANSKPSRWLDELLFPAS
jgi:hypothetical protein